jgi:hypothetical protein
VILVPRGLDERLVGNVWVQLGHAGAQHLSEALFGIEPLGLVPAQLGRRRKLVRVAVGDHDLLAQSAGIHEIDRTPICDLRHREPCAARFA